MREEPIGGGSADNTDNQQHDDPDDGQPGQEKLGEPDTAHNQRHANIRLHQHQENDKSKQRHGNQIARQFITASLLREHPGGHNRK